MAYREDPLYDALKRELVRMQNSKDESGSDEFDATIRHHVSVMIEIRREYIQAPSPVPVQALYQAPPQALIQAPIQAPIQALIQAPRSFKIVTAFKNRYTIRVEVGETMATFRGKIFTKTFIPVENQVLLYGRNVELAELPHDTRKVIHVKDNRALPIHINKKPKRARENL